MLLLNILFYFGILVFVQTFKRQITLVVSNYFGCFVNRKKKTCVYGRIYLFSTYVIAILKVQKIIRQLVVTEVCPKDW